MMCKLGDECVWLSDEWASGLSYVRIYKKNAEQIMYSGYICGGIGGEEIIGTTTVDRWKEWQRRDKYDVRGAL